MGATPLQGDPLPDGGVAPTGPAAFAAFGASVEKRTVNRWTDAAARLASIPAANTKAGWLSFLSTTGKFYAVLTDAGAWVEAFTRDAFAGTEGALTGTAPSAGTLKIRKNNTEALAVNASGDIGITFPGGAFGNGVTSLTISPGAASGSIGYCVIQSVALGTATVRCYTTAGALVTNGTYVRVNYSAVGW